MKRIFWGLVKIALLVGVLVLGARFMMSDEFSNLVEERPEVEMENLEDVEGMEVIDMEEIMKEVNEEVSVEKETVELARIANPETVQQKKYVNYSEGAGNPGSFTTNFSLMGSEPLSAQIARMVGEPVDSWSNLAVHKKTFWILSELALRGLNVDSPLSVSGARIEVENGGVSVDMSNVSSSSPATVLPTAGMSYGGPVTSVAPVSKEAQVVAPSKRRRMSAIDWQTVVEIGQER